MLFCHLNLQILVTAELEHLSIYLKSSMSSLPVNEELISFPIFSVGISVFPC